MSNYSIVRVGNEYIVQAGEKSIFRISSRRRAVKLVSLAADLLDQDTIQQVEDSPSINGETGIPPDSSELP